MEALKNLMAIQLSGRFGPNSAHSAAAAAPPVLTDAEACASLPASRETLEEAAADVLKALDQSIFAGSAAEVGSPRAIVDKIIKCYLDPVRMERLKQAQDAGLTGGKASYRRIAIIAAGGTPHQLYGTGEVPEACSIALAAAQQDHGLYLDVVPLFFPDFRSSIIGMAVAVATVILVKLRADEQSPFRWGQRVDTIMFGCKGTDGAALAALVFFHTECDAEKKCSGESERLPPLHLIGFGTDLSQGFPDIDASVLRTRVSILTLNSIQDSAIGDCGRKRLEAFLRETGCGESHFYDIDKEQELFHRNGPTVMQNPDHSWYDVAFQRKSALEMKERILCRIAEHFASDDEATRRCV